MSILRISILLFFQIFLVTATSAQLFINELIASNSSGISDPDFDDTGDWIELFNNSNITIDLSDYTLTDNLAKMDKWKFPDGTQINANAHLLIWADGKEVGLHTNFKLSQSGEEVGLYDAQGTIVDSIIYQQQQTDISFGRKTDGNSEWGFFETPTPDASNNTFAADGIVFYRAQFSVKGGFYNGSFEVALSAIDGAIRYTTDGSFPTLSSSLYTSPILIDQTTILRARVFVPNYIDGKTSTQSYFVNENLAARKLPIVSIAINPEYFWDASIGLYVQDFKPDWKYPINIELFENDGSDRAAFNELAGTKVNGENSWQLPQKMLGIYFDNEYDQNNLDYPLFFDRTRNQYDNFVLRVSGSDWSATMMCDGLTQSLTKGITDLGQTGFRPSIVFVNGEYLGIHNMRSRMDEGFIEENYGLAKDEYDLIENNGVVEQGDAIAFNQLFSLLNQDLSVQSNYDAVAAIMDIENCIDFYVTEIWSSNSSYGHNIQFWKPKAAGTKWRWIAQDFDRAFSGTDNDLINQFTTAGSDNYDWVGIAFENLLSNEAFADAFVARFADHLFTTYHPQRVEQFIEEFKKNIILEMPYQIARWQGTTSNYGNAIPSFDYWENKVQSLKSFAQERPGVLYADLIDNFSVTEIAGLGVVSVLENGGAVFINDLLIPEETWMGNYFKNLPFELRAEPAAGHSFEGWYEVGNETLVAKASNWKYLDDGSNLNNDWILNNFNDASWSTGQAQLGYGDGDENTVISYGANSNDKHITTYFRHTFNVSNANQYSNQLQLNLLKDDGAIVYLNGVEVVRTNMPEGLVDFETTATDFVSGASEEAFLLFSINVNELLEGENVLAVEVHQQSNTSSDMSFDLELKALNLGLSNLISTDPILQVNLSEDKFFAAQYEVVSTCILPDTVFSNTVLTIDCSPYLVQRNVVVQPNITLTVEAGVEIYFPEKGSLTIHGDLQVQGIENLPVRFLPNPTDNVTEWGHLFFENTTDTSSLVWLEIIGASQGTHPAKENAAIAAWKSILELNHVSLLEVNGNPILTRYSDIWLENSQLHSEVTGDLINVKYGFGSIDNCEFIGNDQIDTDAIDYDDVANGVIKNSKITGFLGFNSDAIDLGENSSNILIENNFIHHIADKGISVGQKSTVFTKNNTIVECNQGIAVKDEGVAIIDQTTFYNNAYDVAAFEKNIGIGGGNVEVYNSIFANTAFAPMSLDEVSNGVVENTLSDTDSLLGNNLLFGNPLFENPTQNDFHLQFSSPAIGAGLDLLGNVVDLGTSIHLYSAQPSIVISAIHYHPLDFATAEFLRIYNPSEESIDLSGYAFTDGINYTFPAGTTIAANETVQLVKDISLFLNPLGQNFQWTSGALSNDGEQLVLRDAAGIIVDHVTYNDQLPWSTLADGGGVYLELISADLDNHFGENWNAIPALPTSVEEINSPAVFTIAPNPTADFITVQSANEKIEVLSLYDALGRRLFYATPNAMDATIGMEGFPSGVYFISINDGAVQKVMRK